jgi:membrane-associated phospholipid phosphatase
VCSSDLPGWLVIAAGGGAATAMLLGDDAARWNHAKGLAETLATGSVLTAVFKVTFGRRRPDYRGPGQSKFGGENRSFLSGHSTQAFEIATYSMLYLRDHGLAGASGWARGAAFAGLYAGAALVATERVLHHRHHKSDVIAGALLGTAVAVAFYTYQEARLPDEEPAGASGASGAVRRRGGLPLAASWAWTF